MNRKLLLYLLAFSIIRMSSPLSLWAQRITNKVVLENLSQSISVEEKQVNATILRLAKKNGWPFTIKQKNDQIAMLTGLDNQGFPIYTSVYNNTTAAATLGTSSLWSGGITGLDLSGSSTYMSNKLGIWDGGKVRSTHVELTGRILQKDNTSSISDHATHVSGTLIASGINPVAKGMSYGAANLVAYDFNNHMSEISREAPNLLLSNHSYGVVAGWNYNSDQSRWEFYGQPNTTEDYKFGYYDSETQLWDSIAYNAPYYLIVKSAGNNRDENGPDVGQTYWRYDANGTMVNAGNRPVGINSNDGYDIIATYGVAKNILTLGAVGGLSAGYSSTASVSMSSFSSWGPTDDGRIKPDVVADGVNLQSCIGSSDDAYAIYSGTSMASPNATGSIFLLQEYYHRLNNKFMFASTLKGLIIHTADEAGSATGPDYQFGWGLINMVKAAALIGEDTVNKCIYENVLTSGDTTRIQVVASAKGSLIATICWTDPKGAVDGNNVLDNRIPNLVNDLDLRVSSGADTVKPWILDPLNPSGAATTGDNKLDNVERVEISSPIPGKTYTLTVTHKGVLARGQQAYSLLISGGGGAVYCTSEPTTVTGAKINRFAFSNVDTTYSASSCKGYRDLTVKPVNIQGAQVLTLTAQLGSCDGSVANKIVKVFIDLNGNGNFSDAGEMVAQSSIINNDTTYITSITIPDTLKVGFTTLMRVIVQETNNASNILPCGSYGKGETQDYKLVVQAALNDVGVGLIEAPQQSDCATDEQYITLHIRNYGTGGQSKVPFTLAINKVNAAIATYSLIYPDTIPPFSEVAYTFQQPFSTISGGAFNFIASTKLLNDQSVSNDKYTAAINITSSPKAPDGSVVICNGQSVLSSSNTDGTIFWYANDTAVIPLGVGTSVTTTVVPADNTYYIGQNDASVSIGIKNKSTTGVGDYNAYTGNVVHFHTDVPVVFETARLYIGNSGQITILSGDLVSMNQITGVISYYPGDSVTLNAYATRPFPAPGEQEVNDNTDTGAIFRLNLSFPTPGEHILILKCKNGATIFRNKSLNISQSPYPFTADHVVSIVSNSAVNNSDSTFYKGYYYFYYDLKVKSEGCASLRKAVQGAVTAVPIIAQNGNELTSSLSGTLQWYKDGQIISGAINQTYTAVASGLYTVKYTTLGGCISTSIGLQVTITAFVDLDQDKDMHFISPNPNSGTFELAFHTSSVGDLKVNIINVAGQNIYEVIKSKFIGDYSKQVTLSAPSGVYLLRIQHGNKSYLQKFIIQ